jgi:hypothetical protein
MSEESRYRLEDGEPCVDVKITARDQLFDNRDPAPFRERDLDPDLSEYLLDASEDLIGHDHLRVVFWLDRIDPSIEDEIEHAFHAHFGALIARTQRARRRRRRTGQVALVIAVILVVVLLAIAQFVARAVPGSLGAGLKEGLVISSWVVMWRPIEILIYDWIPTRQQRKVATKLLDAAIVVRASSRMSWARDVPPATPPRQARVDTH